MQPVSDLTTCDQEPIQWPGFIKGHGYLLALDPATFIVWQASENIRELVNQPVEAVIGQPMTQLSLGDVSGTLIQELLNVATRHSTPEAFNPYRITIQGRNWNILLHQHDGALIIEIEPATEPQAGLSLSVPTLLTEVISDIQRSTTLAQLLDKTVEKVWQLTGFDRVMVYRFDEDQHGEIVSEARQSHLEPYLGLHYPASDIPRQARELYKINLVRCITDVLEPPVRVYPLRYAHYDRPLDLTYASLRAVSPLHIEYLTNMGVRASMGVSLMYQGELWGMLVGHHYSGPRFIDYPTRQVLKLAGQLLSTTLGIRKEDEDSQVARQLQAHEQTLHQQMLADWDVVQGLTKHPLTALAINAAAGAALLFEGQLHTLGHTPSEKELRLLMEWLQNTTTEIVFQTTQLPKLYPPAEGFRDKASGILMLVLSRQMNEYLIWFKPEQIQSVTWAGNPDKPMLVKDTGEGRLSPRKSFEKWTLLVRNKSLNWSPEEVATALKLREDLLQLVAQKATQIRVLNEQLQLTNEELEAFSFTVSHDLRAPLTAIKSQTEIYLEDYGADLDEPARAIFARITKAGDRMSQLIRNVMHYSRTGRLELTPKPLLMGSLLEQLIAELQAAEPNGNVSIQLGATPALEGDQTMITQVFSNLLTNAVKYSRHVATPQVSVVGHWSDREVIYSVRDNGIGIDMKQAGKVFELFQRLDSATDYEGDGVGLAIVKRIMSRHGGKVWFESTPYQSTTFYVSFPNPAHSV